MALLRKSGSLAKRIIPKSQFQILEQRQHFLEAIISSPKNDFFTTQLAHFSVRRFGSLKAEKEVADCSNGASETQVHLISTFSSTLAEGFVMVLIPPL